MKAPLQPAAGARQPARDAAAAPAGGPARAPSGQPAPAGMDAEMARAERLGHHLDGTAAGGERAPAAAPVIQRMFARGGARSLFGGLSRGLLNIQSRPVTYKTGPDGVVTPYLKTGQKVSKHAQDRTAQRGSTLEELERVVAEGESFDYEHGGVAAKGFHDPGSGSFAATKGDTVTTFIPNPGKNYVDNLKKKKP